MVDRRRENFDRHAACVVIALCRWRLTRGPLPASATSMAGRCLAPARSALSDLAERGRTEDLDATVLPGRSLHATHVHRPGIDAPAVIALDGLAGVPVESLAAARCVEAQQPGAAG